MLPSASELYKVSKAVQEAQNKKREERMQELMEEALARLESEITKRAEEGAVWYRWEKPSFELVSLLRVGITEYSKSGYGFWLSCGLYDVAFVHISWESGNESTSNV